MAPHLHAAGEHPLDKGREVKVDIARHEADGFGRQDVHPPVDGVAVGRLLLDRGDAAFAVGDDAERHLHLIGAGEDGRLGIGRAVPVQHQAVVLLGQDVAVRDHDRSGRRLGQQAQGAARAQPHVLAQVPDVQTAGRPVPEVGLDLLGLVVDGEEEVPEPLARVVHDDGFEDRPHPDLEHRLGCVAGQFRQAFPTPPRHDDHRVLALGDLQVVVDRSETGDGVVRVEDGQLVKRQLPQPGQDGATRLVGADHGRVRIQDVAGLVLQAAAGDQRPPDVSVTEGAQQATVFVDDQRDPDSGRIDHLQRAPQRGVRRDERAFPTVHAVSSRVTRPGSRYPPETSSP